MVPVDRETGFACQPRFKIGNVAIPVKTDDAPADSADQRVAMSERRRREADLPATVLHASEKTEIREQRDRPIDSRLTHSVVAQRISSLADRGCPVTTSKELPNEPALSREGNALLTKDG